MSADVFTEPATSGAGSPKQCSKRTAGDRIGEWTLVHHIQAGVWLCRCVCGTTRKTQPATLARYGWLSCVRCDATLRHWTAKPLSDPIVCLNPERVRISEIVEEVAGHFDLHKRLLYSSVRFRRVARPRQLVFLLAREFTKHSYPQIGRSLGGRDHTTILHGVRAAKARIQSDPEWAEHYRTIRYQLEFGRAANGNEAEQ